MHTLYCDPSDQNIVKLWLLDSHGNVESQSQHEFPKSEEVLYLFKMVTNAQPVKRIVLVNQAESFTLIRILATVCNALRQAHGSSLYVVSQPVAALPDAVSLSLEEVDTIHPQYSRLPNIS